MTKVHQRSVVTREGWYYLFILAFVVLGSLLRNIQLMVGLSTILATAMMLNWRWSKVLMRGLVVRPLPKDTLWAGQTTNFRTEIENPRSHFSAFSLMISQKFKVKKIFNERRETMPWYRRLWNLFFASGYQHFHLIGTVHPGQRVVADLGVVFRERGEYEAGNLCVATHFPLGLVRREWSDGERSDLVVGPAIGTLSQTWVEQMLGLGWQDSQAGQSARSGDDFFSLRPYTSGDSRRWIHWRASARHNSLLVRQFQRSQSKAFSLVVDFWSEATHQLGMLDETEKMLRVLATISAAIRSGQMDSVRLTLLAESISTMEFPASDVDWQRWHRDLSLARPHHDIGRARSIWRQMAENSAANSGRASTPVVWMSPVTIDGYVRKLQAMSEPATNDVESENAANLARETLIDFWKAQPLIRSWLTPGDAWLSSWYLEPNLVGDERGPLADRESDLNSGEPDDGQADRGTPYAKAMEMKR
jgi:hypothetical protein